MSEAAPQGGHEDGVEERKAALIDSAFFGPNKQYVRWDTGLHELFEEAVEALGGAHAAKPANIRDRMGIPLLTTAQVKSHLQKHRIRVVAEKGSKDATEAQARAAAKLLERQKRQADGAAPPARPRVLVPIRGSRQLSGGLPAGLAGSIGDGSKRPKRRNRKRKAFGDGFSSTDEEEEYDSDAEQQWEMPEPAAVAAMAAAAAAADGDEAEGLRPARRSRRERRRRAGSSGFDSEQHGETEGEGRSAGTTTASPSAHGNGQQQQQQPVSQSERVPFLELSRMLTAEGVAVDPDTIAGLAQRHAAFVAAATAAAGLPAVPSAAAGLPALPGAGRLGWEGSSGPAAAHQPALVLPNSSAAAAAARNSSSGGAGSDSLSVEGAVATLNRQAQLEHALLEQSMWVQKLAAEVQELRNRQRLGLPPAVPDANALSSPFAVMAQAAFPGGTDPAQPPGAQAAAGGGGVQLPQLFQTLPPKGNLGTWDSTLLRLLSTTLGGQGSWTRREASDAAALLQGIDAAGAEGSRQAEAAPPPPLPPAPSNPLSCMDSGLLRMLSQSLRDAGWPSLPEPANDATAHAAAAVAAAAARLAAEAGHTPAAAAAAPTASPFAAAAAQALPPPSLLPAGLQLPNLPRPLSSGLGLPGPGLGGPNRQASIDVLANLLGLAGNAHGGPTTAARALSTAEFLRVCSLPGAADLFPFPSGD